MLFAGFSRQTHLAILLLFHIHAFFEFVPLLLFGNYLLSRKLERRREEKIEERDEF